MKTHYQIGFNRRLFPNMTSVFEMIEIGFRVPSIDELETLFWNTERKNSKAVFNEVFEDGGDILWSSSSCTRNSSGAWAMSFSSGYTYYYAKNIRLPVRLLRRNNANRAWLLGMNPAKLFVVSGCGRYVLDKKSGLEWARYIEGGRYSWQEIVDLANGSKLVEFPEVFPEGSPILA